MTAPQIAVATCTLWPTLSPGLALLVETLRHAGLRVAVHPWQSGVEAFATADLILPLAVWDYAEAPDAFAAWLDLVEATGRRFANPTALIRWNMNKAYLCDLAAQGVPVVPSVILNAPAPGDIRREMAQRGWHDAVVKPAIGQSGHGVRKITTDTMPCALPRGATVLQPFLPDIAAGEVSLIFIDAAFSHAVRRCPAPNDWRANSQYGASVAPHNPSDLQIALARQVLLTLPACLYARVDLVSATGGALVSEVELIEPALFLEYAPRSRLSDAVDRIVEVASARRNAGPSRVRSEKS